MTETNIEFIEALDFEFAPPCEVRGPFSCSGDNTAEWIVTTVPCCDADTGGLFCDPCLQYRIKCSGVRCTNCGAEFFPAMTAYRSVVRLND